MIFIPRFSPVVNLLLVLLRPCSLIVSHSIGAVPAKERSEMASITTYRLHPSNHLQPGLILSESEPDARNGHKQASAHHLTV